MEIMELAFRVADEAFVDAKHISPREFRFSGWSPAVNCELQANLRFNETMGVLNLFVIPSQEFALPARDGTEVFFDELNRWSNTVYPGGFFPLFNEDQQRGLLFAHGSEMKWSNMVMPDDLLWFFNEGIERAGLGALVFWCGKEEFSTCYPPPKVIELVMLRPPESRLSIH